MKMNKRRDIWKFLVKTLPEGLDSYKCKHIEQGYLNTNPDVRIRKSDEDYILTYKGDGMLCREEYNLPLTKEAYEHLKAKIDGTLIQKRRYLIPLADRLMAELDIFEGKLAPLQLVEVEFETKEDAERFAPPVWFGEDVTFDKNYKNNSLCK